MSKKVIIISIDGMRPDGFLQCGNDFCIELMKVSSYSLNAKTVFPSVTLPCHMSLFLSVPPERHGITTNVYTPPVRPVNGLFEQAYHAGKTSAMYYGWDPLRDVSRPGSLKYATFIDVNEYEGTDRLLTDAAMAKTEEKHIDLVFLYMGETDEKGGHENGWMSDEYLHYVSKALDNVKRVYDRYKDEYTIIITSDHGGHDRTHGSDIPEDMTIPVFFIGDQFKNGKVLDDVSITDIAPTVADIMAIPKAKEWEGRSLIQK